MSLSVYFCLRPIIVLNERGFIPCFVNREICCLFLTTTRRHTLIYFLPLLVVLSMFASASIRHIGISRAMLAMLFYVEPCCSMPDYRVQYCIIALILPIILYMFIVIIKCELFINMTSNVYVVVKCTCQYEATCVV